MLPDGEEFKSLEVLTKILDKSLEARLDRKCTFVALGGGVIGDMVGFAAAIYQRGVKFVQVGLLKRRRGASKAFSARGREGSQAEINPKLKCSRKGKRGAKQERVALLHVRSSLSRWFQTPHSYSRTKSLFSGHASLKRQKYRAFGANPC